MNQTPKIHKCRAWLKVADWLERPVIWLGRLAGWLILPLIGVIIFDAVSRKFLRKMPFVIETGLFHLMNSPKLQDSEWHMHAILFLLSMGYAYVYNALVRLVLFRPMLGV